MFVCLRDSSMRLSFPIGYSLSYKKMDRAIVVPLLMPMVDPIGESFW